MTEKRAQENISFSALEIAADWLDRQDALSADERQAFKAWLGTSDENASAYAAVRQAMLDTALLEASLEFGAAVAKAEAFPAVGWLEPLRDVLSRAAETLRGDGFKWLGGAVAVAALLLLVAINFSGNKTVPLRGQEFATALRQRADYRLQDRSTLFLDADSKVSVVYSSQARDLALERGEAIFEVTKDAKRPFNVAAHGITATAVGTQFGVSLMDDAVEVRVFRGVVKVSTAGSQNRMLKKGQWLVLDPRLGTRSGSFDPATYQTWRTDWLEADHMPLSYIVAKLNRYTNTKIVIGNAALADVPLTGRFQLSNTDATVTMISALLHTTPVYRDRQIYLLPRNG